MVVDRGYIRGRHAVPTAGCTAHIRTSKQRWAWSVERDFTKSCRALALLLTSSMCQDRRCRRGMRLPAMQNRILMLHPYPHSNFLRASEQRVVRWPRTWHEWQLLSLSLCQQAQAWWFRPLQARQPSACKTPAAAAAAGHSDIGSPARQVPAGLNREDLHRGDVAQHNASTTSAHQQQASAGCTAPTTMTGFPAHVEMTCPSWWVQRPVGSNGPQGRGQGVAAAGQLADACNTAPPLTTVNGGGASKEPAGKGRFGAFVRYR